MWLMIAIYSRAGADPIIILADEHYKHDSAGACMPCAVHYLKALGQTQIKLDVVQDGTNFAPHCQDLSTLISDIFGPALARSADRETHDLWGPGEANLLHIPPPANPQTRRSDQAALRREAKRRR